MPPPRRGVDPLPTSQRFATRSCGNACFATTTTPAP